MSEVVNTLAVSVDHNRYARSRGPGYPQLVVAAHWRIQIPDTHQAPRLTCTFGARSLGLPMRAL